MDLNDKSILIVRTDRIGDVVLTLPAASKIKQQYPGCRVTFLLRSYTRALADNNPYIDEVLLPAEKNNKTGFFSTLSMIRKKKFDCAVMVSPAFRLALIIFLAGIKQRIGTGYRWYSFLFSHKVFEHRKYAEKHELEYNVNLLSRLGVNTDINPATAVFGLKADLQSDQKIGHLLGEIGYDFSKPMVIFHPGSGGSAVDLPENSMKKIIELVARELNVNIVLTGSASEKQLCGELIESISDGSSCSAVYNLAGMSGLQDLIALINRSVVLVANSTGPIHIAAALGKYVIGFYPKIAACSKERWGPYSRKAFVFEPETGCSGCSRETCESTNCMQTIRPERVFNTISEILGKV